MRVLVVGATGTIGSAVAAELASRHEVVPVSRTRGEHRADIADPASVETMYRSIGAEGSIDAVVCAAGESRFGALGELGDDDFRVSLASKLMGQVNLVRLGLGHVADGGSFTLTAGILGRRPMPGGTLLSLVNGALEGFTRAADLDLPRGLRINVVSPGWVRETMIALGMDPTPGTPAAEVARAYARSVEGDETGAVIDAAGG